MAWEREREVARRVVADAAEVVLDWYRRGVEVEWKGEDDPVTSADHAADDLILERLAAEFPDDAVLSEERRDDLSRLDQDRVWIVDPLDGTKDFVTKTGDFAVMVGLACEGVPVVGAVCAPLGGRLWHAARGEGALLETPGAPTSTLRVSDISETADMRLVVTRSHRFALLEEVISTLGITAERPLGSVGLKVGALSTKTADLYVHMSPGIKEWDTCGPEVILTEAGGVLTDCFGEPLPYNGRDVMRRRGVIASNGQVHGHIVDALAPLVRRAFVD